MSIMTRKEEKILDNLIELAGGDRPLVEKALKTNTDLSDIVSFILAETKKPPVKEADS